MLAVVERPPFELNKKIIWTNNLLICVFKPIQHNDLSDFLYKKQQIKLFAEATGLFVSITWEKCSGNCVEV